MGRDDDDTHGARTLPVRAPGAGHRRRILIVTLDVLSPRMAGPAIRAWHLAEQLARRHEVILASPKPVTLPPGLVDARAVDERRLRELVAWCEIVVFQGFALSQYPFLARADRIVVVDAYAPLYLEQLEQAKNLGAVGHAHVVSKGVSALNQQLARADFIMCASEKQRDLYLGTLGALGRVNPATYGEDATLRTLIDVVPFGLPAAAPKRGRPAIKGVVPGIGLGDRVVLWGGGVYNWFDPLTLIRAMATMRHIEPNVKLYFLGLVHPNPDVEEMDMAREARTLSLDLGLTGTNVFFNESWVPYNRRGDYLLEADVAVSTQNDHLESAFSFRTRVLDYLWAGLPMVLTEGDALAALVADSGAGRTVPPGDIQALVDALLEVLTPEVAARCRQRAAAIAASFTWDAVTQPLEQAVDRGQPAADRRQESRSTQPEGLPVAIPNRRAALVRDLALAKATLRRGGPKSIIPPVRRRLTRLRPL